MSQPTMFHLAVPLYVSWRVLLANRLPITDCDETYNYFEPLHFLLFQSGHQVWEYGHEYALRTYAYLLPLQYVAKLYQAVLQRPEAQSLLMPLFDLLVPSEMKVSLAQSHDKLALFVLLRSTIALMTALAEVYWLSTLYYKTKLSGRVVLWTALLLLCNAGMSHSAAAFLPSSTWTAVSLFAFALVLQQKYLAFVVVAVSATLATGWPFGAALLAPSGLRVLVRLCQQRGTLWTLLFIVSITTIVQSLVMLVDHKFYGIWTAPTLNIFRYNAAGGGDELYGTEPVSYYIKNLLINCNLAAVLGVPAVIISYFTQRRDWDVWVMLLSMWLWIVITFTRPHKEERFLFPMYPMLCLGATLTIDAACNAAGRLVGAFSRHKELSAATRLGCHAIFWVPTVLLSLARTAALMKYYMAPFYLYAALSQQAVDPNNGMEPRLVCTCGEWYRFPSSFFLPEHVQLGFLPSSFEGQLPQPFSEYGSLLQSQKVLQPFNDRNLHETSRYVSLDRCEWIVDLRGGDGDCISDDMEIIARAPFLDAAHTSTLHRVLYIPFWHEAAVDKGHVRYLDYVLAKAPSNTYSDIPREKTTVSDGAADCEQPTVAKD